MYNLPWEHSDRNFFYFDVVGMWRIIYLPVYFYESAGNAQQIVEPPQNQTVPVNSVARFTCRTTSFVVWEIDGAQLSSDSAEVFKRFGITVENENQSVLLVNATLENNRKTILCQIGLNRASLNVTSEVAVLTVFGE